MLWLYPDQVPDLIGIKQNCSRIEIKAAQLHKEYEEA